LSKKFSQRLQPKADEPLAQISLWQKDFSARIKEDRSARIRRTGPPEYGGQVKN